MNKCELLSYFLMIIVLRSLGDAGMHIFFADHKLVSSPFDFIVMEVGPLFELSEHFLFLE